MAEKSLSLLANDIVPIATGESAFSTIAPTVLGDLFSDETRTVVLGLFYLAIPIGSGLGYSVGGEVAHAAGGAEVLCCIVLYRIVLYCSV